MSRFKYNEQDTPNKRAHPFEELSRCYFFLSSSLSTFSISFTSGKCKLLFLWLGLVHFVTLVMMPCFWVLWYVYLSNKINGRNKVINFIFGTLSNRIFYRLINDGQIIIGKVFVLIRSFFHFASPSLCCRTQPKKKEIHSILFARYEKPTIFYPFGFMLECKSKSEIQTHQIISRNEDITSSKNKRRRIYLIEMEHFYIYTIHTRLSQRFM